MPAVRTPPLRPPVAWRATAILLLLLAAGGAILFLGQHAPRRISVDVLELLPRDEQDPTIRLARQTVSGRFGRTLYIALHDTAHPDQPPVGAAALVAAELRADPAFGEVFTGPGRCRQGPSPAVVPRPSSRLAPARLARRHGGALAQGKRAGRATRAGPRPGWPPPPRATWTSFQNSADALAYQERLPGDPLLLIPGLLAVFGEQDKAAAGSVAGGALTKKGPDGITYALIQAETRGSQMEEAGQTPVFAALDRALKDARAKYGASVELRFTGVNKFASETREHGLKEVSILTWISLGLSFVLLLFAFRRVGFSRTCCCPSSRRRCGRWWCVSRASTGSTSSPSPSSRCSSAWRSTTASTRWSTRGRRLAGLRRRCASFRLPLVAGCLTSVGGFVFMTLTNLPMLQQMGLAVALGLIFSLGIDFLYLPWVPALRPADLRAEGPSAASGQRLELGGARFPLIASRSRCCWRRDWCLPPACDGATTSAP